MRYFGGKSRIAGKIAPIIHQVLIEACAENFYDLFCGSCNVISRIDPEYNRYANDIRQFMVSTMSVGVDYDFPAIVSEEDYVNARLIPETDPLHGFILVGCSFAGKYRGGYARSNGRNYATNAKNSLAKKIPLLQKVKWSHDSYDQVTIEPNSVIYCDIPYHGTTGYDRAFDHDAFYSWVAKQTETVLISEYEGSYNPLNLETVWRCESKHGVRAKEGRPQKTVEVLRRFN